MRKRTHLALAYATAAEPDVNDRERRVDVRRPLSELPWLNKTRLKYGPTVAVLDLSPGGAHIETEGHQLQPGSTVVLEITSEGPPLLTVPAQVVRCQVAGFSPQTIYRGGLAFKHAIDFPDDAGLLDSQPKETNPLHDHARMTFALKRRFDDGSGRRDLRMRSIVSVGADAVAAAIAMMESASRMPGGPLARELSRLFNLVTEGLEQQAAPDALLRTIADQLRRVVPTRTIRLVECKANDAAPIDAISFDVPCGDESIAARLLVHTWPGTDLHDWHLQYLKASAYILGLVRQLQVRMKPMGRPAVLSETETTTVPPTVRPPACMAAPVSDLPSGWHRVVVRYLDGRMLKGYSREFTVSSTVLEVWPSLDAPLNTRISVPLGYLKAVFFVRDFEGDPERVDGGPTSLGHGRLIAVTFVDGETMLGTTLNYSAAAAGFFIRPVETDSNNARVYVGTRAIRHVQFPAALPESENAPPPSVNTSAKSSASCSAAL